MVAIMVGDGDSFQRSLGRIEGLQGEMLRRMDDFSRAFRAHTEEDHLALQVLDGKLSQISIVQSKLEAQDENTKAIGKYILGIFATLVTALGAAVVAALTGHLAIK